MGVDVVHTRKTLQYVEKFPVAAIFTETKEKVLRAGAQKPILGAYTNNEMDEVMEKPPTTAGADGQVPDVGQPLSNPQILWENSRDYFRTPFPREYAEAKGQGKLLPPPPKVDLKSSRHAMDETGNSTKDGPSARIRVGLVDKQEAKKRWQSVMKAGLALLQRNGPNGPAPTKNHRGSIIDAQNLLDDAAQLPPFTDAPGDDFAEVLRVLLADLMKAVLAAREYVAIVRDALSPLISTYGKRGNTFLSIAQLKTLLSEGGELPFSTPEEKHIREIIATVEKVNRFTRKLQSKCVYMVSDENQDQEEESKQSQNENFNLEEVSDMLKVLKALPLERSSTASLEDMYQQALSLGEAAAEYTESANSYRNRTKIRSAGEAARASLDEAEKLINCILSFPLDLSLYLLPLETLYNATVNWKEEVRQLVGNSGQSKSGASSDGNKPGSSSIKRVEALIIEGEKMIFDVSNDLDALREKRSQAKEWLERLKKSFAPKAGRAQSLRKSEAIVAPHERIALADMKLMVLEGEQLYDDDEGGGRTQTSRELSKAHSVVEVAEEWLSRVREALADSSSNAMNTAEIKELLGESEDMPVFMEEALVLRSHLRALEWAKRAKRVLYVNSKDDVSKMEEDEKKGDREGSVALTAGRARVFAKAKLADIQRLAREITKIRADLPESIATEFALTPLQEEIDCHGIVKSVEEWITQMKRLFQGSVPKKGVKLEKLRALYQKGSAIPLTFEAELRPVKNAIKSAENWIHSNASMLTRMGIACNLSRTILEEKEEIEDKVHDGDAMHTDDGNRAHANAEITYDDWRRLVNAAEVITTDFEEVAKARECLTAVDTWILHIQEKCPKRFAGALGKRNLKEKPGGIVGLISSSTVERGWPSKFMVNKNDIEELLVTGERLALDMRKEKQMLKDALEAVKKWNEEGFLLLEEILSGSVRKSVQQFYNLGKENINSLAVCFAGMGVQSATNKMDVENENVDHDKILAGLLVLVKSGINSRKKIEEGIVDAISSKDTSRKEKTHEELLWQEVQDIKIQLEDLQHQGEEVGISVPVTLAIDVCVVALRWIDEARELLNPARRKKHPKDRGCSNREGQEWGDVNKETIVALIEDALNVISQDCREETTSALLGTRLAQPPASLSAAIAEYKNFKQEWENDEAIFTTLFGQKVKKPVSNGTKNSANSEVAKEAGDDDEIGEDNNEEGADIETEDAADGDDECGDEESAGYDKDKSSSRKKGRPGRKKHLPDSNIDMSEGRPSRKRQRSTFLDKDLGAIEKKPRNRGKVMSAVSLSSSAMLAANTSSAVAADTSADFKAPANVVYSASKMTHFAAFKKLMQANQQILPLHLQRLVDFYVHCLGVLLLRILEADEWASMVQSIMSRSYGAHAGGGGKQCILEVSCLLEWAMRRNIESSTRNKLEEAILQVDDWVRKVNAMKRRDANALLEVDELRDFCRAGEKLLVYRPEATEMREELRRAKSWIRKLQATGIEKGTALTQDLQILLPESETICADFSAHVDAIYSAVKTYCLCRQAYFGHMVGCDTCDDWYHLPCVGLNKAQADKIDKYNCIRCNIKTSFDACANFVGSTANKWANIFELRRDREQKKLKVFIYYLISQKIT